LPSHCGDGSLPSPTIGTGEGTCGHAAPPPAHPRPNRTHRACTRRMSKATQPTAGKPAVKPRDQSSAHAHV
jgi:hypothetical protein